MASERARDLRKRAQDATVEAVRAIEENGELRHLYGRPLDLGDDGPDWFLHRMLKRDDLSLPLIERGKDIDAAARDAAEIIERLRRRRAWLTSAEARLSPAVADDFNAYRIRMLEEYRAGLVALNKAIIDYNLTAPSALHRRGVIVDQAVERATADIELLKPTTSDPDPARPLSWRERVRRRVLGER